MNFAQFETEDRRLVILRGLASATGYRINEYLLKRYLDTLAHEVSQDRLAADLAWLAEQSLITVQKPEGVTVAILTTRGLDVAEGRAHVPGIARPQPGA